MHQFRKKWRNTAKFGSAILLSFATIGIGLALGLESHHHNFGHRITMVAGEPTPDQPAPAPSQPEQSTPISRNQFVANVIAQSYQNIYVPVANDSLAFTKISQSNFYSPNLTDVQWENQRSLLVFIMAYMQANANKLVASNPKFSTVLDPESILQNFGLNFAAGIYETNQNIIEIPVSWGQGDSVGDSLTDITIFFDPQIPAITSNWQNRIWAQQIVNQIVAEFPSISVQNAKILPTLPVTAFNSSDGSNSDCNQQLLLTYLAEYIQVHADGTLLALIGTTNILNYLQVSFNNPSNFQVSTTTNEITCYIFWGNGNWQSARSDVPLTISGF